MGFEDFVDRTMGLVGDLEPLKDALGDLPDGRWSVDLDLSADESRVVGDLGQVRLEGAVDAAIHLTRRAAAPESLGSFVADPGESEHAFASATFAAEKGARLDQRRQISAGAGIAAGAESATSLGFGQHRCHPLTARGVDAVGDLLRNLRNPFELDTLRELAEGEVFGIEWTGRGSLTASASWQAGIARSFEGTDLESLAVGQLGGFSAGVTAGVTVRASIDGELRVLVHRSPRDARLVRVRLQRKRGDFIGAGLSLSASAEIPQADAFVDSVFSQVLELPDGLVGRLESIEAGLDEIQSRLDGLEGSVEAEISELVAEAGAKVVGETGLDLGTLNRLRSIPGLSDEIQDRLAPLVTRLDEVESAIDAARGELAEFVDSIFTEIEEPLETLAARIRRWLDSYREARSRAREFIASRVQEGVSAELTAGLNRTRTSEALLELDFAIEDTGLLCIEAMKGNFTPALERARAPGATGVEIVGGTLREVTRRTSSYYNLRLNLLGFRLRVDFQRFDEVEFETDARTGMLTIAGRGGARLTSETRRRFQELSFLFDAYGAFEQRGDVVLTSPETDFRAHLLRTATYPGQKRVHPLIRKHLGGARRLGLLDAERATDLAGVLLDDASATYGYELRLSFPPDAIRRMFSLDLAESDTRLRIRLWRWIREGCAILDIPIAHPRGDVPLSETLVDSAIEAVRLGGPFLPGGRVPDAIRALEVDDRHFAEGASRQIWFYLRDAHDFVESYLAARRMLRQQVPLRNATRTLSQIAARAIRGVGALDLQPFDAKYLVFALAEGLREVEISMTFRRGNIDVTL